MNALFLRIDIKDILSSDIPHILGCYTREVFSDPSKNLPQGIYRLEILEGFSGPTLYNGPLPPVSEQPSRHVVWCPLPKPLPKEVNLSLFRNETRILTAPLLVPPPLHPVPCFRNRACDYSKGLRVGSIEGFASYSIRLENDKYIHVANGRIKDLDATMPFGYYPVLSPGGMFSSVP